MKLKFGSLQYYDIEKRIVPISPKPLRMLTLEALEESLTSSLLAMKSFFNIKSWRIKNKSENSYQCHNFYSINSLRDIQKKPVIPLGNWQVVIRFFGQSIPTDEIELCPPTFCNKIELIREKKLKSQRNSIYFFVGLEVDLRSIIPIDKDFKNCSCPWESLWANGFWQREPLLFFVCRQCGRPYICECFRNAIETYKFQLLKNDSSKFQPRTHKFLAAYEKIIYRKEICHLCTNTPADFDSVFKLKYSTSFSSNYYPYINRKVVCDPSYWDLIRFNSPKDPNFQKKLSDVFRTAENRIREVIGINPIGLGWATEAQIYYMIKDLFPDEPVIHQGSPSWLKGMRFDVFLPARNIAVEYQGVQHFKPIDYFGGEAGLEKTKERDRRKWDLSKENGIRIIYLHYNEQISRDQIKSMILKATVIK